MYPSVLKYYEKNQFVDIFYTRKALKTGPYSIASVHSLFKKPQALQKNLGQFIETCLLKCPILSVC